MSDTSKQKRTKAGVLLPPAVGYSFNILLKLIKENSVSPKYYLRFFITGLINLINKGFRAYERRFINRRFKTKKIERDPIFILGHWRSGTTHLHNLLCEDQQMAYNTTFQGVFPDTLFNKAGRFIFEGFTKLLIPGTRKGDNVKLRTDFPQEEEFALGSHTYFCYYYFWIFPKNTMLFYDRYVNFNGVSEQDIEAWKQDYSLLIKKAIKNTSGDLFISKNPPNTGRIKTLLGIFPNAKFIHIHRNPVEVFLSTRHFYKTMMPYLELHSISESELETFILSVYKALMEKYLLEKSSIPPNNLIEVSFEDLESKPNEILEKIYNQLEIPGFETAKSKFDKYLEDSKSYKKNKHLIKKELLDKILTEWDFAMKEWNYNVPENVEILYKK